MPDETVPLSPVSSASGNTADTVMYDRQEDEQILYAAYRSNLHVLSTLVSEEPDTAWRRFEPTKDTLLHRIAEGGYPNCHEAANFILDNWRTVDINSQNAKGWTPLHNACYLSQQAPLVQLLLQNGADTTIPNEDGENPFHLIVKRNSPEAIKIAELLLEKNPELMRIKTLSGMNIIEIILKNSALNMLEFLWARFKNESGSAISALLVESGKEGPTLCLAIQKGDGHDTVKCVQFLLDILPKEAVNMKGKDGNTGLHVAAKYGYVNTIKALVSNPKTNVFQPNDNKETCLHLLTQASGKYSDPIACLETLFRESYQLWDNAAEKRRLILPPVNTTESPLMMAVKNRTTKVVQLLTKEHGDIDTFANNNKMLTAIYEKTPEAIIPLLDKCITYLPSTSEDDLETINVNMGPITGYEGQDIRNESQVLHGIFNSPVKQQRKILSHPVVNIFLMEKWKKLQPLTYLYILSYGLWLSVYSCLCYEIYPANCPDANLTGILTDHSGLLDLRIFRSLGFQQQLETENCNFNSPMAIIFALILMVYTPLFVIQEAIKFTVTKCGVLTYVLNRVTILHWIRHTVIFINILPAFMKASDIPVWQYHVAMVMFTLAWLMLLNDLANIPDFALLLSILVETVKKYGKFLIWIGFPILVAFVPALSRYVAKDNQFLYLPFGIIKNFILMTGEVDYKETFYGDDGPNLTRYAIVGQFIIVIAVFGFGLVLANVLTGVAVKNFQDLVKDAEYKTASMQLESINFVDSLIVWLNGLPATSWLSQRLSKLNHLEFTGVTRTMENMKTEKFSEDLKQLIKEIAIQKPVIVATEGKKPVNKAFG